MTTALVADPSEAARQTAARMLESLGFRVATACNAAEALALVRELAPGLVLADARLETADGGLAIAAIRKISGVCLFHVSADGGAAGVRGAMEAGADDYLVKPYDAALLGFKLAQARTRGRLKPVPRLVQDNAAPEGPGWRLQSFGKAV
ncbi:response regulator [Parvibaculum sp.]|uniref:response regulator n=1 Tax=Parvibaculum sp. TaxID=2024848 RepID=UPI001D9BAF9D|nr:response regulator [Parvibaculum sp.]MBX3488303.1 response regulator [Parvibaculum sp.]MCW5727719.1 response regulator [Parvibaculum sp.]